jgi:hypothetical protein
MPIFNGGRIGSNNDPTTSVASGLWTGLEQCDAVRREIWHRIDADAQSYITAVEAADGQALEVEVKNAINNFVLGCKDDGIWDAIKASCILAGARTLAGALVPLVGTAPTNYNFVAGDYDRETGLVGDGSTKYLDSNRNNDADPQNNSHMSVYVSTAANDAYIGEISNTGAENGSQIVIITSTSVLASRLRSASTTSVAWTTNPTGLIGLSRSNSSNYVRRFNSANATVTGASIASSPQKSIFVFRRNYSPSFATTSARFSFYSIGESLDLALLDSRVSTLMSNLAAAIP